MCNVNCTQKRQRCCVRKPAVVGWFGLRNAHSWILPPSRVVVVALPLLSLFAFFSHTSASTHKYTIGFAAFTVCALCSLCPFVSLCVLSSCGISVPRQLCIATGNRQFAHIHTRPTLIGQLSWNKHRLTRPLPRIRRPSSRQRQQLSEYRCFLRTFIASRARRSERDCIIRISLLCEDPSAGIVADVERQRQQQQQQREVGQHFARVCVCISRFYVIYMCYKCVLCG